MLQPEFDRNICGCPGTSSVEETVLSDGTLCLVFFCFDEEGKLLYFKTFPRDATPDEIAECIEQSVEDVFDNPPTGMNTEDVAILVERLKEAIEKVPGLVV